MEENSIFLSEYDLKLFTGFQRKTKQVAFLKSKGIAFEVNGRGKPVIRRSDIDKPATIVEDKKEWRPNKGR